MGLRQLVARVEGSSFSLWGVVFAFLAIALLRTLLEGLFGVQKAVISFEFFLHYTIFYASLFLSYSLALKLLSGARVEKVTKGIVSFWWILLLVPFIDLFFYGARGFQLTYLWGDLGFILANSLSYGAYAIGTSVGQKVVVGIAVILSASYIWVKTRSAFRAIAAALAVYFLAVLYAAIPSLLMLFLHGSFSKELVPEAMHLSPALFLLLAALQLLAWLAFFEKKKALALLKNLQLLRLAHYLLMAFFGLLIFQSIFQGSANLLDFSLFIVSGFFAFQASIALNDLSDRAIDKSAGKKTIYGPFSAEEVKAVIIFESAVALAFACLASFEVFALVLGMLLVSWLYSMPPFRAKRFPMLSTFSLALVSLLACYAGFFASGAASVEQFPWNYGLLVLVFVSLGFNAKDLKDMGADREAGVKSLPVMFGEENARRIISLLVAIAYLSAFALTMEPLLLPFALFFSIFSHFLLTKAKCREIPLLLSYFAFAVVLAYLVFGLGAAAPAAALTASGLGLENQAATENQIPAEGIEAAINRGVGFLESSQLSSGEFATYGSGRRDMADSEYNTSPFITSFVFHSLGFVEQTDRVSGMRVKAVEFIKSQRKEGNIWNFWGLNEQGLYPPIPDDLDDTSCAAAVLAKNTDSVIVPDFEDYRAGNGAYFTWMSDGENDVDCVVNANILMFYSLLGKHDARLCAYLNAAMQAKNYSGCTSYYATKYAFPYFVTRAFADANAGCVGASISSVKEFLLENQSHGFLGNDLDNALATVSLLNMGFDGTGLDRAVKNMVDSQNLDGSWDNMALSIGPYNCRDRECIYFGSSELATAISLEALAKYQKAMQKKQVAMQRPMQSI